MEQENITIYPKDIVKHVDSTLKITEIPMSIHFFSCVADAVVPAFANREFVMWAMKRNSARAMLLTALNSYSEFLMEQGGR